MDPTRVYVLLSWAQWLEPHQSPLLIAAGFSVMCMVLFGEAVECFALYLALCIAVREMKCEEPRTYTVWMLASQTVLLLLPTQLPFYMITDACWQDLRKTALFCVVCGLGWVLAWNPVYVTCVLAIIGYGVSRFK
jgi:hypothetical protein